MVYLGFKFDTEGNVIVTIDGACPFNGYPYAKGGIGVWFGNNRPLNVSEPLDRAEFSEEFPPTNQVAEIKACIKACKILKEFDSQYLIESMTNWIYKWLGSGWLTSYGRPLKHQYYFKELLYFMRNRKVQWEHIPSAMNQADFLAQKGAENY